MKTTVKKCIIFSMFFLYPALFACNEEWKDEQYEKTVSFVKSGYTEVYLKYREAGGVAPYKIPLVVSGSTGNGENVKVTVALDPDTMPDLNYGRFRNRTDLYFKQLEPEYYDLKSTTVNIPAGEDVGLLDIDFKLEGLDLVDKYILPLQITETSTYLPSPRKHYKKTMMRIIPFNDYSGSYQPTGGNITFETTNQTITFEDGRETRVVDEKTVFFYAGFIDEQARDRATYKIYMRFNEDSTLTLNADKATEISFEQVIGTGNRYSVQTEIDPTTPYLERRYTAISLDYRFTDISNPQYPMKYRITGTMTMERKRNTLIPEEDQQFIFE
jgi:hypothetical protein